MNDEDRFDLDAEDEAFKQAAIDQIPLYYRFNEEKKAAEESLRQLDPKNSGRFMAGSTGPLRTWLNEHPYEELSVEIDGIGTVRARLLKGGVEKRMENIRLQVEQPNVWEKLNKMGYLIVDVKALEAGIKEGVLSYSDVAGYLSEEPRTPRLDVGKA